MRLTPNTIIKVYNCQLQKWHKEVRTRSYANLYISFIDNKMEISATIIVSVKLNSTIIYCIWNLLCKFTLSTYWLNKKLKAQLT